MLWGRVTYEMMERYWPAVARGDVEAPPAMREWAVKLEAKPKYVVSSTRKDFRWTNSHYILRGGLIPREGISRFSQRPRGDDSHCRSRKGAVRRSACPTDRRPARAPGSAATECSARVGRSPPWSRPSAVAAPPRHRFGRIVRARPLARDHAAERRNGHAHALLRQLGKGAHATDREDEEMFAKEGILHAARQPPVFLPVREQLLRGDDDGGA